MVKEFIGKNVNPHIAKVLHRKKLDDSKNRIQEEKSRISKKAGAHLSSLQQEMNENSRRKMLMKHKAKKAKKSK